MTKIIPMNFESHPDEFAFFLRFLSFSPIFFQMLIFMCHKFGQKTVFLLFFPLQKINRKSPISIER